MEEIKGPLEPGKYLVVNKHDVPPGATILNCRIIHAIKKDSNEEFKTRLVIQRRLDPEN